METLYTEHLTYNKILCVTIKQCVNCFHKKFSSIGQVFCSCRYCLGGFHNIVIKNRMTENDSSGDKPMTDNQNNI